MNPVVSEADCGTIFRGNVEGAVCTNDYGLIFGGEHINHADARIEIDAPRLLSARTQRRNARSGSEASNLPSEAVEDNPVVRFIAI